MPREPAEIASRPEISQGKVYVGEARDGRHVIDGDEFGRDRGRDDAWRKGGEKASVAKNERASTAYLFGVPQPK